MIAIVLAGSILTVCILLLIRLALPLRQRLLLDATARDLRHRWRHRSSRKRQERQRHARAEAAARAAIRRAQAQHDVWDGNVFRASAFESRMTTRRGDL